MDQNTLGARASKFDAFLARKAPAERANFLALSFREPRTIDEWRLWSELQAEFTRWRRADWAVPPCNEEGRESDSRARKAAQ